MSLWVCVFSVYHGGHRKSRFFKNKLSDIDDVTTSFILLSDVLMVDIKKTEKQIFDDNWFPVF